MIPASEEVVTPQPTTTTTTSASNAGQIISFVYLRNLEFFNHRSVSFELRIYGKLRRQLQTFPNKPCYIWIYYIICPVYVLNRFHNNQLTGSLHLRGQTSFFFFCTFFFLKKVISKYVYKQLLLTSFPQRHCFVEISNLIQLTYVVRTQLPVLSCVC